MAKEFSEQVVGMNYKIREQENEITDLRNKLQTAAQDQKLADCTKCAAKEEEQKQKDKDFDERNFPRIKSDILPSNPVTSTSAFVENLTPEYLEKTHEKLMSKNSLIASTVFKN